MSHDSIGVRKGNSSIIEVLLRELPTDRANYLFAMQSGEVPVPAVNGIGRIVTEKEILVDV